MIWTPYGEMMSKISESQIPYPHRNVGFDSIRNTEDKEIWKRNTLARLITCTSTWKDMYPDLQELHM